MSQDLGPEQAPEAPDMGTVVLMLGLYLIILAFFILLNAISEVSQEKTELVQDSLAEGFSFTDPVGEGIQQDPIEQTAQPIYDDFTEDVQGILRAHFVQEEYTLQQESDYMKVIFEVERFFHPGANKLKANLASFFDDMAVSMAKDRPGTFMIAQVMIRATPTDNTQYVPYDPVELAGRRAALFLRALLERGAPNTYTSATAELNNISELVMKFRVVEDDQAKELQDAEQKYQETHPQRGVQ